MGKTRQNGGEMAVMKRVTVFALACMLLLINAAAETALVAVPAGALKMRNKASASAAVIAEIPDGETILAFTHDGSGWALVDYYGIRGYVLSKHLTAQDAPTPSEVEQRIVEILDKPQYLPEYTGA
jgi:uncharacterized protein YraI